MIRLLVTDLDNTLYDWFEMWTTSFALMLSELVRITGIDQSLLEAEIKSVHQARHTSEYSALMQEVPSLVRFAGGREATDVYASAIAAFRQGREAAMVLYDGVQET